MNSRRVMTTSYYMGYIAAGAASMLALLLLVLAPSLTAGTPAPKSAAGGGTDIVTRFKAPHGQAAASPGVLVFA